MIMTVECSFYFLAMLLFGRRRNGDENYVGQVCRENLKTYIVIKKKKTHVRKFSSLMVFANVVMIKLKVYVRQ